MNQRMSNFNKMITEIYNNQLTFICYLRKKLVDAKVIRDSTRVDGLDCDLHCFLGEKYPDEYYYGVAFSIESPEIVSISCPYCQLIIKLRICNNVVWLYSREVGRNDKSKLDDFIKVVNDAIDKWNEYISCYEKVTEDKKYEFNTPDCIWNKMKNIGEGGKE